MPEWKTLVRYVNDRNETKYGEPILPDDQINNVSELAKSGKLQVKICNGNSALDAIPSTETETVKKLLGPLTPSEVPIIRCIGLNYKTHSK